MGVAFFVAVRFQSAVRISVWLKSTFSVSSSMSYAFQSAVRISVWLKDRPACGSGEAIGVSIRRADLCLVEELDRNRIGTPCLVSIRRADLCLVEAAIRGGDLGAREVSIRRADLCLVEDSNLCRRFAATLGFNPPCGSLFG